MASKYKVEITGKDKSKAAFNSMQRSMGKADKAVASLGRSFGLALGAGGIAAAFGISIKAAAAFEKKIAEISTLLDDTSSIDNISDSVRQLAIEFGGDVISQSTAMYQIISAGAATAAEATDILTASNKLAVGGVTDVSIAADGLTSILNAYGNQVKSATSVSDALFVAVKAGKTTVEELSVSIGAVAPIAAQTGVSLDELLAATATLTKGGVSTSEAMTGLRGVMAAVLKPMDKARKTAARLGIDFTLAGLKSKGLAGFIKDVTEKTKGSATEMASLFGRVEGLTKVLALSGSQAEDYTEILGKFAVKAGEAEIAYGKMTETFDFQYNVLIANLKDVGIVIGTGITPALTEAITKFNELFALLNTEASSVEKASGYFNSLALFLDNVADRLGMIGVPLNLFAKGMRLVTTSAEELIEKQSAVNESLGLLGPTIDSTAEKERLLAESIEKANQALEDKIRADEKYNTVLISVNNDLDKLIANNELFGTSINPAIAAMESFTNSLITSQMQMDLMADKQLIAFQLWQDGSISVEIYQKAIESLGNEMPVVAEQIEKTASDAEVAWSRMTENMQRAFGDLIYDNIISALDDGKLSFKDFTDTVKSLFFRMIADMVAKWAAAGIAKLIGGAFGGGSTVTAGTKGGGKLGGIGGGIAAGAAIGSVVPVVGTVIGGIIGGIGGLLGFSHGGQFKVGGSGGTDSQLVQFKASPNERVTVETPAQQNNGSDDRAIIINMSGDMNGLERFIKVTADSHRVMVNKSGIRATEPAF